MASPKDKPQSEISTPFEEALRDLLQLCTDANQSALETAASRLTVR